MSWFIFKRLTSLIPILLGISLITFILLHLIPGDPAVAYLRASHIPPTDETVAALRVELGLNKPLYVQYFEWLGKVLQLDLGMSYVSNNSVWEEIVVHFFPTVQLTIASLIFIVFISLPLGMISAIYKGKFVDQFSRILAFVSVSMPTFWLGFLLIYFLSVKLDLFPVLGRGTLAHLVLPSLTLAFAYIGTYMRLLRASMLGNLNEPFVVYARARGLRQRLIVIRHVLKKSLLPVVTGLGMSFGNMLSGAVIVETIFAWPGMGQLFVTSILNQDYPMIQGCVLFMGVIFVVCNLLVDLTYSFLDPRIRWEGEK
ncbi:MULTISPECIES: nickel ABC transporter permease [unclassified Peribacillus]|uniref:nickel ABC transporter permease n=1 Tax=unclassified Peribacillus TaxID=2675266 RepID=UPI001912CF35|nr:MULTISPECIES: nickel ABC transporter permease [unclassified Peribacillus]MBK5446434.1 ABC transporter permease subunit [Peribacillus sp. TH24]MBK5458851.1 ABC transporter permease subunit [Peribacillus sp. TH27]MBK5480712.1 ABC transporter permease subunit [Peribacillus sp. TH16]MBK5502267.1 ABC transporter permease subunit [Peribacillus sp. TH14]WMX57811.1 ABC transporter permease subunit [Peribacillus sp. R9-11]